MEAAELVHLDEAEEMAGGEHAGHGGAVEERLRTGAFGRPYFGEILVLGHAVLLARGIPPRA
jgi:hypothetical protein